MDSTADDKRYAIDSRLFGDAVRQDGIHAQFEDSPVSSRLKISDICTYRPGDKNKIGKEGKTSWDSFSYALLMAHNVWMHIEAVQRANRCFDSGQAPSMLVHPNDPGFDARLVIDQIFRAQDRSKSLAIIDDHASIWERVIGTRGFTGKRAVNAHTMFDNLFSTAQQDCETDGFDQTKLDQLEEQS